MTERKQPCGCGGVASRRSDLVGVTSMAVNGTCHGYLGGVTGHQKHTVPNARIVLIYWDQYFTDTPAAVTSMDQFVTDLATGYYWNALSQYGVGSAMLNNHAVMNMQDFPTPNSKNPGKAFSPKDMQDQLEYWLTYDYVGPAPAGDEKNLVYLIFAPSDTTLSHDGDTGFCGYHQSAKFHATTSRDNLIWGTVQGYQKPTGAQAGQEFVDSISYCVSHELSEALSNPDGQGYFSDSTGCEISDICEAHATGPIITVPYEVSGRTWQVEQYWSDLDGRCLIGSPTWLPRPLSPIAGYATSWNSAEHVNYIGQDGNVHELVWNGSRWRHNNLTGAANVTGTSLPGPGSPIDGYATSWNSAEHVNYIGLDGNVHELVWYNSEWAHNNLSQSVITDSG